MIHKTEDNKLKIETKSARNLQQGQANSIMFTSFRSCLLLFTMQRFLKQSVWSTLLD